MTLQTAVALLLKGAAEDAYNPFRWLTKRAEWKQYLKALAMFKDVSSQFVDRALDRARQEQAGGGMPSRPTSILGMMVAEGMQNPADALTKTEMMNEIITFLYAG